MTVWVVDNQPARRYGGERESVADAARAAGQEVVETVYDPVNGLLPNDLAPLLASGRPLVLRGSVGFAAWAHDNWPVRPGAFRSPNLHASAWLPAYGDLALNAGAIFATRADWDARRAEYEARLGGGAVFVKPADGGKLLSGVIVQPDQPLADAHFAAHRRWSPLPDDYRLLLAPVHDLRAEWRFVIAGGDVAAASLYKIGNVHHAAPGAPAAAEAVARDVARHPWRPAAVFVADVAETPAGFSLLELNTFGTAGLYACDLDAVVQAVLPFAM